jgi:peptidoglycan-associated lipoprotein
VRRLAYLPIVLLVGCKSCGKEPPTVTPPAVSNGVVAAAPTADPAATPEHVATLARNFARIFFEFNAFTLDAEGKAALQENAAILQQFPEIKIEVQGHADERGTTDFNVALGQKRADAVVTQLQALGVAPSRVKVVSYGEERPLDASGSEVAWAKNRRCEFAIRWAGDAPVQGSTAP